MSKDDSNQQQKVEDNLSDRNEIGKSYQELLTR